MFEIFLTDEAKEQLNRLATDKGLSKRYNAVKKALHLLSENPRHPGLKTMNSPPSKAQREKRSLRLMQNSQLLLRTESSGITVQRLAK